MKQINKFVIAFIIFIILLIAVLFHNINKMGNNIVKDFTTPIFSVQKGIKRGIINQYLLLNSKRDILLSLEKSQQENLVLKEKLALYKAKRENENELRYNIDLLPLIEYDYIYADVVLRDPVFWKEKFIINKGTNDRFEVGCIVLSPIKLDNETKLCVVGKIEKVFENSAVVATIYNENSNISVKLSDKEAYGVLKDDLIIHYLPAKKKYNTKEFVYTSGYSDLIPSDFLIGESIEIKNNEIEKHKFKNLYTRVKITPVIDINNLDIVVVVRPK